jgi:glycerol-3-phosphate acyltransferase PlsX
MRIVVDAMGTDDCPIADVAGSVDAARLYGETIVLVGDEQRVRAELGKHNTAGLSIEVVHAPEAVLMTDKPSVVTKARPNSSMHIGMNLVKDGQADAFVSAGNTGAALSIATLATLRRIPGVRRPALSAIIQIGTRRITLVDVGANADCKPDWLVQFAVMGSAFTSRALGVQNPRIGILSNGEEEGKGNQLIRDASALLRESGLAFIGNIEPKDLLSGHADVVVCDGFVGNILIKSIEGSTSLVTSLIREELMRDLRSRVAGLLAMPAFRRVRKSVDPFEIGGAPLLGVNGVVIIAHGRSNALGIRNAIRQARQAVQGGLIEAIREGIGRTAPQSSAES